MVATVPQAEIVDEQQLSRDVTDIEFQAESLVIQTDEDYALPVSSGKMLKKKASRSRRLRPWKSAPIRPTKRFATGKGHADPAATPRRRSSR